MACIGVALVAGNFGKKEEGKFSHGHHGHPYYEPRYQYYEPSYAYNQGYGHRGYGYGNEYGNRYSGYGGYGGF